MSKLITLLFGALFFYCIAVPAKMSSNTIVLKVGEFYDICPAGFSTNFQNLQVVVTGLEKIINTQKGGSSFIKYRRCAN